MYIYVYNSMTLGWGRPYKNHNKMSWVAATTALVFMRYWFYFTDVFLDTNSPLEIKMLSVFVD